MKCENCGHETMTETKKCEICGAVFGEEKEIWYIILPNL
jgi:uncharacterized OB-fold protein